MRNWVELEDEVIRLSPLSIECVLGQWNARFGRLDLVRKDAAWRMMGRAAIDAEKMRLARQKRADEARKAKQRKADLHSLLADLKAEAEADAFLASFDN